MGVLPGALTRIAPFTFTRCHSLKSITIGNKVKEIQHDAIRYCTSLETITIPSSVAIIGRMAFAKCSSLEQVDFPDSVTHIEDCAFVGCSSLYAKPPASVQSYGPGASTFLSDDQLLELKLLITE